MIAALILLTVLGGIYSPSTFKSAGIKSYRAALENPSIKYTLKADDSNSENLSYEPNITGFTALSFQTEMLSIGVSVQSPNKDPEVSQLDKSEVFDLQFIGIFKELLWELYYQNYQGLYFKEGSSLDLNSLDSRADSYNYGFSLKYFSNKDFRPTKSLGSFSKKKQSGWSTLHGITANKSRLKASHNSVLVPLKYHNDFTDIKTLKAIDINAIGYSYGITGMYLYKNFYVSGLFALGIAAQEQKFRGIEDSDRFKTASNTSLMFDIGGDFGARSIGITARFQTMDIAIKESKFSQSRLITSFYYQYTF